MKGQIGGENVSEFAGTEALANGLNRRRVAIGKVDPKQPIGALISISAFVFLMYIPLGYYTDMALYRRRQRQKANPKP